MLIKQPQQTQVREPLEPLRVSLTRNMIFGTHTRRVVGGKSNPKMKREDGINQVDYEKHMNFGDGCLVIERIIRGEKPLTIHPSRRVKKAKTSGGYRYVDIPTLLVVHVTSLLLEHGLNRWEPKHPFYGYPRPTWSGESLGKHAALAKLRGGNDGKQFLVVNDVKNAFGSIPFDQSEQCLRELYAEPDLSLARNILRMRVRWPDERIETSECGVPQGLSLSGLILAMVLRDLPKELEDLATDMIIYVDDIMVLTDTEQKAHEIFDRLHHYLEARGLCLKYDRTHSIYRPGSPVRYLGDDIVEWEG